MNVASQDRIHAKENEFRKQWWSDSKFGSMKSLTTLEAQLSFQVREQCQGSALCLDDGH